MGIGDAGVFADGHRHPACRGTADQAEYDVLHAFVAPLLPTAEVRSVILREFGGAGDGDWFGDTLAINSGAELDRVFAIGDVADAHEMPFRLRRSMTRRRSPRDTFIIS